MNIFAKWQIRHAGLFTFAQSPKNVRLYQKFGFWPRFLTAIMSKPVSLQSIPEQEPPMDIKWTRYSKLTSSLNRQKAIEVCRDLTDMLYPGLDLRKEIYSVEKQRLGDTILIYDKSNNLYDADDDDSDDHASTLIGLAICHCGPRTEAESGTCYIKFGAIRPAENASTYFDYLLDVCESYAKIQGLSRIVGGSKYSPS